MRRIFAVFILVYSAVGVCDSTETENTTSLGNIPRYSCSNIKPVENINLTQLSGSWLKLETQLFSYGHPWRPSGNTSLDISPTCHRLDVEFNSSATTLSGSERYYHQGGVLAEAISGPFVLNVSQEGRWTITADHPGLKDAELVVVSADPSQYLAVALCFPLPLLDSLLQHFAFSEVLRESDRPAAWPAGERLLTSVSLAVPRGERGGVNTSPERLGQVREQLRARVGIDTYQPFVLGTYC